MREDAAALLAGKRLVVGSLSPAKVAAVKSAMSEACAPHTPLAPLKVSAPSGVNAQPWGEEETRLGAVNRARAALTLAQGAELGVGIEAGLSEGEGWPLLTFAWVVIAARGAAGGEPEVVGVARSASFAVPYYLAARVRAGVELGDALDAAHGLRRAKDGPGAVGVLTGGLISRSELYRAAVILALIPWLSPGARSALSDA